MSAVPRGIVGAEVIITFTIIASLTLFGRLYTRYVLVKNPGGEELAIIFAWVFSVVHTSLVCTEIWRGLGDNVWNLSLVQQENILLPFYASVPMYSIALFLTKVSILLLYIRLFPREKFVKACRITILVMGAFLFWTIFGFMFLCSPVKYFWNKSIEGHCFDSRWVYFTNAPFNILTDFVLFGLPLKILLGLQLPNRQKIGLVLLFGVGLVGCLTSILRLRSLYVLSVSTNITHDNLDIGIWSVVEVNVGICCACGPTLKPLINLVLPQLLSNVPSKLTKRERLPVYGMNPLSSDVNLTKKSQGTKSHANFEGSSDVQFPEPGKVMVTTDVWQEVDAKNESTAIRLQDVDIARVC